MLFASQEVPQHLQAKIDKFTLNDLFLLLDRNYTQVVIRLIGVRGG